MRIFKISMTTVLAAVFIPLLQGIADIDGTATTWVVKGRTVDIVRLEPAANVTLHFFTPAGDEFSVSANPQGLFMAELPIAAGLPYMVAVDPSGEFEPGVFIRSLGDFKKMKYEERILKRGGMETQSGIRRTVLDMEIGLYPKDLTYREEQDLERIKRMPRR